MSKLSAIGARLVGLVTASWLSSQGMVVEVRAL